MTALWGVGSERFTAPLPGRPPGWTAPHASLHTAAQCLEPPKNECTATFRRPQPQSLASTCWPPP